MVRDTIDCTVDGRCSRCGSCCTSLLPLTPSERASIGAMVKNRGIRPSVPDGKDFVTLQCPFLRKPNVLSPAHSCAIYAERPAICRSFRCDRDRNQNMFGYVAESDDMPDREPTNVWSFFGMTGVRIDGVDVPWDDAPQVTAWSDDGKCYRFAVGRYVSLSDKRGRRIEGMVLVIQETWMGVMDRNSMRTVKVPYLDIDEVFSESSVVADPPPMPEN